MNLDIREQILFILSSHPKIKNQNQLAEKLKKKDSEVSRLLSGMHNLTLETIAKLTAILGHDIIMTDLKAKEKYQITTLENYSIYGIESIHDKVNALKKIMIGRIDNNQMLDCDNFIDIHQADYTKRWSEIIGVEIKPKNNLTIAHTHKWQKVK